MQNDKLKEKFARQYRFGFTIIAIVVSVTFYFHYYAIKLTQSTTVIVDLAAQQEVISQRIASLTQHYYTHMLHGETADSYRVKRELIDMMTQMRDNNERLSSGTLTPDLKIELSKTVFDLYFGKTYLKSRVDGYLNLVNQIFNGEHNGQTKMLLHTIALESANLLGDLHGVSEQYQKEGDEKIERLNELEMWLWISTLLVLILEIVYIFKPMAEKSQNFFNELQLYEKNLESEIDRRTQSLEETNFRLEHLASHDPLTGLKNRLNLEKDLEELIRHFKENHIPFSVAMIDIDWFKKINDNYGHDIGDEVLKELSFLISNAIRGEDSAYRAGGEEFVIIFTRITESQAIEKMEALRHMIQEHTFVYGETTLQLSISGGLYHPDWIKASSVQNILKLTDDALYEAKRSGRNKIITTHPSTFTLSNPLPPAKSLLKLHQDDPTQVLYADFDIIDLLGYPNEDLVDKKISLYDLVYPEDRDFFDRLKDSHPFMTTLRMYHANGTVKIVKIEGSLNHRIWKIEMQDPIALAKSVGDGMIAHNFEAMMTNTDDFIYFKDRYHVFTAGSQTLVEITNVETKEELIGKTDYEVFPLEFADKYFILEKEVFSGEIAVARDIQPYLSNDGQAGWVDNRKYPIKNALGEIVGLFGIARIISEDLTLKKDDYV